MFKIELDEKVKEIEELLKGYLPREEGLQETVMKAVNYSVLCGGKRLRPLFLVECNVLCGGAGLSDPLVCAFAAALEMIHTYSLVHDDLPAMDNDKYRRGQLTTHAKYGEAMGILTGDALLNLAFETVSGALEKEEDVKRLSCGARAIRMLSGKSGIYGMIGGQVVDVERTGTPLTGRELDFIYRLKTGALLEAAMVTGGILANCSTAAEKSLAECAAAVGMAFQIQDDILDVTSSLNVLGKPVHSDEKNQKTTYITLYSIEEAKREVSRLSQVAVEAIDRLPGDKTFLTELILSLINREK